MDQTSLEKCPKPKFSEDITDIQGHLRRLTKPVETIGFFTSRSSITCSCRDDFSYFGRRFVVFVAETESHPFHTRNLMLRAAPVRA